MSTNTQRRRFAYAEALLNTEASNATLESFEPLESRDDLVSETLSTAIRAPRAFWIDPYQSPETLKVIVPALLKGWIQDLYDARRSGHTVGYFQHLKKALRRSRSYTLERHGETALTQAHGRLIEVINRILQGMPHQPNKVEGRVLRRLCQRYGETPEEIRRRPEVQQQLVNACDGATVGTHRLAQRKAWDSYPAQRKASAV